MFQAWRVKIREAQAAFEAGRFEEAGRLLTEGKLQSYRPGQQLSLQVAEQMAGRAQRRVAAGDTVAGWRDLGIAAQLADNHQAVASARQELLAMGLAQAERHVKDGQLRAAGACLDRLSNRHHMTEAMRILHGVCRRLERFESLLRKGQFRQAETQITAAEALRPDWPAFAARREQCRLVADEARRLSDALHQALAASDWSEVLATSDALLELVPEHRHARQARRQAWVAVGLQASRVSGRQPVRETDGPAIGPTTDTKTMREPQTRFLLWVDAVGGYLVCWGDEIVLGPPTPGVDVSILADLSRRHAIVRRDAGDYWIDPLRAVKVAGRAIVGPTVLTDGDVIELGEGVELRFRRPHALSATARLERAGHHRFSPSVDAVLLMAEHCMLGPSSQSHVVCPDWPAELMLFRQGDALHARGEMPFQVDDEPAVGKMPVNLDSRIVGEGFSLTLEPLDSRL